MKQLLFIIALFVTSFAFGQPPKEVKPKQEPIKLELIDFVKDQITSFDKATAEISAPDFVEKQKAIIQGKKEAVLTTMIAIELQKKGHDIKDVEKIEFDKEGNLIVTLKQK